MARPSLTRRILFASVPAALLVLGLVAAELVLRSQNEGVTSTHGQVMQPDPTRIWRLPEGKNQSFGATHYIDADGLRITEEDGAPNRILTLGDSSIYGHGLPDGQTLHDHLEGDLRLAGIESDVMCGGVPGYSSEQALVLLDEVGWSKNPDTLVIGTLYSDNLEAGFTDEELMEASARPTNRFALWLSGLELVQLFEGDTAQRSGASQFVQVGWMQGLQGSGEPRVPLDRYYENLHQMADEAREHDASVVYFHLCARWLYEDMMGGRKPSYTSYKDVMERVARERNVPFVDGCQALGTSMVPIQSAFLDELHPSDPSNKVYAHAIVMALQERGWPQQKLVPTSR